MPWTVWLLLGRSTMTSHLTKPIRAIRFMVLAFLMMLGSQAKAAGTCDTVKGSIVIIEDRSTVLNLWRQLGLKLQSSDILEQMDTNMQIGAFERKYGRGSGKALALNYYDTWLTKQGCGVVDDVRPKRIGMDKQKLIKLCLEHLPKTTLETGAIRMVRMYNSNVFLVYGEKGKCSSYSYD